MLSSLSLSGGAGEGFLSSLAYGAGGTSTLSGLGIRITTTTQLTAVPVVITATIRDGENVFASTITTSILRQVTALVTLATDFSLTPIPPTSTLQSSLVGVQITSAAGAGLLVGGLTPDTRQLSAVTLRIFSELPDERTSAPAPLVVPMRFIDGCYGVGENASFYMGIRCRAARLEFFIDLAAFFTQTVINTIRFFVIAISLLVAARVFLLGN